MVNKILIVVVLYNQRIEDCKTYQTFFHAPGLDVFIFDNSYESHMRGEELPKGWCYRHDSSNPGLSHAYNEAARYAQEKGYEWVLLCDQDTNFANGIIENYRQAMIDYPDIPLIVPVIECNNGIMSPHKLPFVKPIELHGQILDLHKYMPINSGMAVRLKEFFDVGGYKDSVFLDYSDFDFIRLFRRKYPYLYVMNVTCKQDFSNDTNTSQQKLNRFKLFCKSLKACDKPSFKDKIYYSYIINKRMFSLMLSEKSFKPLLINFKYYVL